MLWSGSKLQTSVGSRVERARARAFSRSSGARPLAFSPNTGRKEQETRKEEAVPRGIISISSMGPRLADKSFRSQLRSCEQRKLSRHLASPYRLSFRNGDSRIQKASV